MIEAFKARILFMLSLAPLLEVLHIASINRYADDKFLQFLTLSDYISFSLHRVASLIYYLLAFSVACFSFALLLKFYPRPDRSNRGIGWTMILCAVFSLISFTAIYYFRDYAYISWIYSHFAAGRVQWEYFLPVYLLVMVPVYFSICAFSLSRHETVRLSALFNYRFDALTALVFMPLILFDFQIGRMPRLSEFSADITTCLSDEKQNVLSAIPLEKGVFTYADGQISFTSYDCLKRINYH